MMVSVRCWLVLSLFIGGCSGGGDVGAPDEVAPSGAVAVEAPDDSLVEGPFGAGVLTNPSFRPIAAPDPLVAVPTPGTAVVPIPVPVAPSLLEVSQGNRHPTRMATGPDGTIYVTDALAGSVFVYDTDLVLVGEFKDLVRPLGIAIDGRGRLLVGDDGADRVRVLDLNGGTRRSIALGVEMPNDLATDTDGNLYVADSRADRVRVFDPDGDWIRDIGAAEFDEAGKLHFPVGVVVREGTSGAASAREILVADQGHGRVAVFSEAGAYLRELGEPMEAFSDEWKGRFSRLQAIELAADGRLHALDSHTRRIQIFNPKDGQFLGAYGIEDGLKLPLDLLLVPGRGVVVADAAARRLRVIHQARQGGVQ